MLVSCLMSLKPFDFTLPRSSLCLLSAFWLVQQRGCVNKQQSMRSHSKQGNLFQLELIRARTCVGQPVKTVSGSTI